MSADKITSLKNDLVKKVISLSGGNKRRKAGLFVLEGRKEIAHALNAGIEVVEVFICPEILADDDAVSEYPGLIDALAESTDRIHEVTAPVYAKIAYRGKVEGLVALAEYPSARPEMASLPEKPLILVIEGVEKPGNLGAILRTADGAGVDMVLVADNGGTDLYNPNVIRSSVGAVFTLNVFCMPLDEVIAFLKESGVKVVLTSPDATRSFWEVDYCGATAIVLGSEHAGLPKQWLNNEKLSVYIPMAGDMDSLNVSCSAAITLYEACRQRSINSSK